MVETPTPRLRRSGTISRPGATLLGYDMPGSVRFGNRCATFWSFRRPQSLCDSQGDACGACSPGACLTPDAMRVRKSDSRSARSKTQTLQIPGMI